VNVINLQNVKRTFDDACDELERLIIAKGELDAQILQLKKTIVALAPLAGKQHILQGWLQSVEEAGITENCREVLRGAKKALTPAEVRDHLESLGHKFKSTNPLAAIHAVLKRLIEGGEVIKTTTDEGDVAYQWILRFPRLSRDQVIRRRKLRAAFGDHKPVTEDT